MAFPQPPQQMGPAGPGFWWDGGGWSCPHRCPGCCSCSGCQDKCHAGGQRQAEALADRHTRTSRKGKGWEKIPIMLLKHFIILINWQAVWKLHRRRKANICFLVSGIFITHQYFFFWLIEFELIPMCTTLWLCLSTFKLFFSVVFPKCLTNWSIWIDLLFWNVYLSVKNSSFRSFVVQISLFRYFIPPISCSGYQRGEASSGTKSKGWSCCSWSWDQRRSHHLSESPDTRANAGWGRFKHRQCLFSLGWCVV